MIAALYVEKDGAYYGLPDVDPWDEERDARLYAGPWPVVAHPPCARWSLLAYLNQSLHGYKVGDDGGCFEAALGAVRTYSGVLEHPAQSLAWRHFALPRPAATGGWTKTLFDPGWTCEVAQAAYGHRARKRTWLYYVGPDPLPLDWSSPAVTAKVSSFNHHAKGAYVPNEAIRVRPREASRTPERFRDVLLSIARATPVLASAGKEGTA